MFNTDALHHGHDEDPVTGAISFPIYQTSTFSQEYPGDPREYQGKRLLYARTENPTRTALEKKVACLEQAKHGIAFSSGLAAINAILLTLKSGDHIISVQDLYGGAYRQFTKIFAKFGVEFDFVDTTELDNIKQAIRSNTKMLWLETPTNPLLNVTDIRAACELVQPHDILVTVDNTFATPYLQRPLELGADLVMHSATKYLSGHCDVIQGIVLTNSDELHEEVRFIQNGVGAVPGPQDCFLTLRGLKTLGIRMERHCSNTKQIAEFLDNHPKVLKVFYPGLESHKGHALAKQQMTDFGAMISFELNADLETAKQFLTNLKYFVLAESLGGVKSMVCNPPSMTHASVEPEVRHAAGINDGLIRLSVGIENVQDLIADLEQALETI